MCNKMSYVMSAAIVLAAAVVLFIPIMGAAGSLEPSAAPAPTMKTLDVIPPAWSQKLQCDTTACPRFEVVLDGDAVLDKETGLVWERQPNRARDWEGAISYCLQAEIGGRRGWHLPTIEQLMSLVDMSGYPYKLPSGHPFIPNTNNDTWSATTDVHYSLYAWMMSFGSGDMIAMGKEWGWAVWCVRGGQSYDASQSEFSYVVPK